MLLFQSDKTQKTLKKQFATAFIPGLMILMNFFCVHAQSEDKETVINKKLRYHLLYEPPGLAW